MGGIVMETRLLPDDYRLFGSLLILKLVCEDVCNVSLPVLIRAKTPLMRPVTILTIPD